MYALVVLARYVVNIVIVKLKYVKNTALCWLHSMPLDVYLRFIYEA